ncbi:MAG TPA: 50S ribosomal protein L24 [bacterium]|nr:50S ribosomal protein L24 [bacterium]
MKKDDQVVVLSGKEKGKKGRVMKIYASENLALVEKINYRTVFLRKSQQNPQGGITKVEGKIPVSNLMLVCPRCSKPTRLGCSRLADGTKQRTCKHCHEIV